VKSDEKAPDFPNVCVRSRFKRGHRGAFICGIFLLRGAGSLVNVRVSVNWKGGMRMPEDHADEKAKGGAGEANASAVLARVELDELSGEQRTALEMLVGGKSLAETARTVGVARSTIYEWLKKDAGFRAAYNQWHEMMKESCRSRLKMMLDKATSAVEKALDAGDSKAAIALLKGMGMIEKEQERSTDARDVARENSTKVRRKRAKLIGEEMMAEFGA